MSIGVNIVYFVCTGGDCLSRRFSAIQTHVAEIDDPLQNSAPYPPSIPAGLH